MAVWRESDVTKLRQLVQHDLPWNEIAVQLGRSLQTVQAKAVRLGLLERKQRKKTTRIYSSCVLS